MKSKDFEQYARNQLIISLSILSIAIACSCAVTVLLWGVPHFPF